MTPTRIKNQNRKTNPAPFRVAVLEHADSEALLGMLGRCSPTSLYRRFHGVTNGIFYASRFWRPPEVEIPMLRGLARSAWASAISTSATTRRMSVCWSRTTGNAEVWTLRC